MAILFDLDGTLLDTGLDIHKALNSLLTEHKLPKVEYSTVRPLISMGSSKIIEGVFNLNPSSKEFSAIRHRFLEIYRNSSFTNSKPFPGIEELLNKLDKLNIQWGIVTNKIESLSKPLLEVTGMISRTGCIVCGDTTPFTKPHPEPLKHACKILNKLPSNCVYIGDAKTDIEAGKSCNMPTILAAFGYIPDGADIENWSADFIAYQPTDILPWIEAWHRNVV